MIEVKGGTKKQKQYTKEMVSFCIKKLMPRLDGKLFITVKLEKNLYEETGCLGLCDWEDNSVRPRDFVISVASDVNYETLLTTVAHEMVHVKQFARGEMRTYMAPMRVGWLKTQVDTTKTNYWDLPWEIEAHGREVGLFVRWCEEKGIIGEKWLTEA